MDGSREKGLFQKITRQIWKLDFIFLITVACLAQVNIAYSASSDSQMSGSGDLESDLAKLHHVVIGPAKNLSVFMVQPTSIVIAWMPPNVYTVHNVEDIYIVPGTKLSTSKMKEHMTIVAQNVSDADQEKIAEAAKNSTDLISKLFNNFDVSRITDLTWLVGKDEVDKWECQPFSFFSDFTVGLKQNLATVAEPVTRLKDSHWATDKDEHVMQKGQAIVPFSKGCVKAYNITWQLADDDSSAKWMLIQPTLRTANITNLEPNSTYKISVIAQYPAEYKISNHPVMYLKTADIDGLAGSDCKCDWHGTVGGQKDCAAAPNYCKCKNAYEGPFCERCAPGFYRTAPNFPCHACPCNVHGKNRTTCKFEEGFLKCDKCELGYTGTLCHVCDTGFYRYRKYCVPCHCNGNTPSDAQTMCLPTSGMCVNCKHNTTGFHCEHCLSGYVGDAITYKNCTLQTDVPNYVARVANQSPHAESKSGGASPGVVITVTLIVLLVVGAAAFFAVRRYCAYRRRSPAFWTVGMSPGADGVDISSVHNDVHMDDDDDGAVVDDVEFYQDKGGVKSGTNKYLRLVEEA